MFKSHFDFEEINFFRFLTNTNELLQSESDFMVARIEIGFRELHLKFRFCESGII